MELNTIICGECSEAMKQLPDNSIDLTVTSPPYDNLRDYKGYIFPFEGIAIELWRVTKQGGVVVWVVGDATIGGSETLTSFKQALYFRELGFNVHDTMIYWRDNPPMNDNRYQHEFEFMFILSKGLLSTFNPIRIPKTYTDTRKTKKYHRYASGEHRVNIRKDTQDKIKGNIWRIGGGGGISTSDKCAFDHPAIFPEALARDHIISWSNPGDIVLDPMCGSGTTLKMAVEQGREYIGIDVSQEYCDLSRRRIDGARVPLPGIF